LDPSWVKKLKFLLKKQKCELIGDGYTQLIAPLVPSKVNYYNQLLGIKTYLKILKQRPKIASISEMAYSSGIVNHYKKAGYKTIIMEWNNPRSVHARWNKDWLFYPQKVVGANGAQLSVLWADSIAFQKFQRFVYGEYSIREFLKYIKSHLGRIERCFPLYTSDVEVFNFRPGRYKTEMLVTKVDEWGRIYKLFSALKNEENLRFILPCKALELNNKRYSNQRLVLESARQPILVKKQDKYNINRWLLTGRDDLNINTKCYKIFNYFNRNYSSKQSDWKELCYLWSSDFRTHINLERWQEYKKRLKKFHKKWVIKEPKKIKKPKLLKLKLPYKKKNIKIKKEKNYLFIEKSNIKIGFNSLKGLTVLNLCFKDISKKPLIGTLPHGYYENISYSSDFFSGHSVLEIPGKHKITDLNKAGYKIYLNQDTNDIKIYFKNRDNGIRFDNSIKISSKNIIIKKTIRLESREIAIIHPVHFTLIPTSWNKKTLYFATHNGGDKLEKFYLKNKEINHGELISTLISAKHALGATKGLVIIGDNKKQISFFHDQTKSAIVPIIRYEPLSNGQYFFRLLYSAQEIDETFKKNKTSQKINISIKISPEILK